MRGGPVEVGSLDRVAEGLLAGRRVDQQLAQNASIVDLGDRARHDVEPLVRDHERPGEVLQLVREMGTAGGDEPPDRRVERLRPGHDVDAGEPQRRLRGIQVSEELAAPGADVDHVGQAVLAGQSRERRAQDSARAAVGRGAEVAGRAGRRAVEAVGTVEGVLPRVLPRHPGHRPNLLRVVCLRLSHSPVSGTQPRRLWMTWLLAGGLREHGLVRNEWHQLAAAQEGIVARRQLTGLDVGWHRVESQLAAGRWAERTPRVISTFTGTPTWEQKVWIAVLHAGEHALVAGLTALKCHGLRNWDRDEITVIVDDELSFEPVDGVRFFRSRRDIRAMRHRRGDLPLCRVEPAALLFAGYERSARTAQGLLAATVQQRLTTSSDLLTELSLLKPLRRSRMFRAALQDIGGGAQSLAELDIKRMCRSSGLPHPRRQVARRDSSGRRRFTDCEWELADGTLLILEVDGGFHMEVEHWEDDLARQRRLTAPGRVIVRCTARELRDEPATVAADLVALGLQRSCA